jgi:hypothetical protein
LALKRAWLPVSLQKGAVAPFVAKGTNVRAFVFYIEEF